MGPGTDDVVTWAELYSLGNGGEGVVGRPFHLDAVSVLKVELRLVIAAIDRDVEAILIKVLVSRGDKFMIMVKVE